MRNKIIFILFITATCLFTYWLLTKPRYASKYQEPEQQKIKSYEADATKLAPTPTNQTQTLNQTENHQLDAVQLDRQMASEGDDVDRVLQMQDESMEELPGDDFQPRRSAEFEN